MILDHPRTRKRPQLTKVGIAPVTLQNLGSEDVVQSAKGTATHPEMAEFVKRATMRQR